MIKTRLRFCVYDPDPNGNERYYVRKPGFKKIRIREPFQDVDGNITAAFMAAYFRALDDVAGVPKALAATPREKTFYWLVDQYFKSELYRRFDRLTQADKRS